MKLHRLIVLALIAFIVFGFFEVLPLRSNDPVDGQLAVVSNLAQISVATALKQGVGQRILVISQNKSLSGDAWYTYPCMMATRMNLPSDIIYTDIQRFPNNTLYDDQGNGKYCFVFLSYYGYKNLNSTELGFIDYYERVFNVTEASLFSYASLAYASRYGITSVGGTVAVGDVTWTANNLKMEYSQKGVGNYTVVQNVTLSTNAHVSAYAGNSSCTLPFLWYYIDSYGTIKTACSQLDAAPLYSKDCFIIPTYLALNLSPYNILWTYTFSYDIDDINGYGFGRAWNSTEVQNIINFYGNYSMPFTLAVMNIDHNQTDWQAVYPLIASHPDVFQIIDHPALETQSLMMPAYWNILETRYNLNPAYYYLVPAAHWINASVAQYLCQNLSISMIRQAPNTSSGQNQTGWLPWDTQVWAPFGAGIAFGNWDNLTSINWTEASAYYYNYGSWLHGNYLVPAYNMNVYCGYSSIMWTHYPELRNEQPLITGLEDAMFNLGLYKLVPTESTYAALASRTFEGSYNIINPIYYPSNQTLTFSLANLGTAPDDLCGIVLPTTKAKMDDQVFYAPGHIGSICNSGAFLEFKYVAGKTYTIYLGQDETAKPYITTHNFNSQLWLINSVYSNGKLTITYQPPMVTGLTSKIEVFTGTLGTPFSINGATGVFDSATGIETLTVTNTVSASIQSSNSSNGMTVAVPDSLELYWTHSSTSAPSPSPVLTPLPTPNPTPVSTPLPIMNPTPSSTLNITNMTTTTPTSSIPTTTTTTPTSPIPTTTAVPELPSVTFLIVFLVVSVVIINLKNKLPRF